MSSKTKILIECDRAMQIEIEEHCMNAGITISDYFVGLHKLSIQKHFAVEKSVTDFQEGFKTAENIRPKGSKKHG